MNLDEIQRILKSYDIDGWLLYDFRGINPIAQRVAGVTASTITRRWFCYIPSTGDPTWLIHRIEQSHFSRVSGRVKNYMSWRELHDEIKKLLSDNGKVAMEYSPNASIPYVARVDAGTLELIQSFGVQVVSSANLVQHFEACLTADQFGTHREAARQILEVKDLAFAWISENVKAGNSISEYDVQSFIMERFNAMNLIAGHPPIVAVNANSSAPHYFPTSAEHQPIKAGDFILIDLWAKKDLPNAVYADTTWVAYAGKQVPERYATIFEIVRSARDRTVTFICDMTAAGKTIYGYEVDDVARDYIAEKGYGEYFIHRVGHNIGTELHGNGVNIDNFETRDERPLVPGICFSIEPGIYLPEFGIRSEIDVFLAHPEQGGVIVTTVPVQNEVLLLL